MTACASESAAAPPHLAPPPLPDLLALPQLELFKQDRRSTVWAVVDVRGRRWVIKRDNRGRTTQRLAARLGAHPVQRAALWHGRLIDAGLAVVPAFDLGHDGAGRRHQAAPYAGPTLYDVLQKDLGAPSALRRELTRQAGRLIGQILALRVDCRGLKPSDLTVDGGNALRLVDAGRCRGAKGTPLLATALRTLTPLHRPTQQPGPRDRFVAVGRTDRLRFFRAMLGAWDNPPDGLQHLLRHPDF